MTTRSDHRAMHCLWIVRRVVQWKGPWSNSQEYKHFAFRVRPEFAYRGGKRRYVKPSISPSVKASKIGANRAVRAVINTMGRYNRNNNACVHPNPGSASCAFINDM